MIPWLSRCRHFLVPPSLCLGGLLAFLGLEPKKKAKEDPVVHTIKQGILALQRGEYKKAEQMLHLALKMSQERLDTQAETYCFDVMADIALANNELEKAEKLFLEVMRRLLSTGTSQDDDAIVEISAKLANIYSKRRDDSKAEQGYQFCINTQREKISGLIGNLQDASLNAAEENSLTLLGMCMAMYAKHFIDRGKYREARDLLTQSLEVARKVFGETHPQTLVIRNDLALISTMLKDYKESIRIFEELVGSDAVSESEDLAVFMCNLGASYLANGNIGKAQEYCGKAKEIAKKQNRWVALNDAEGCLADIRQRREQMAKK
ncbi:tetratricopeptide repeat protein 19 [Tropilaelaps mercedesae]|uniref:Tetratricopeptide repeat protein 19 n=1 Tax=Tropilaelaps mercedesae TaxID=418985 RepID=A0A1V9X7E0_9ACAR|nr:tetratricopeptide repeat protein 19 [Tropilaelaps mercedesae]